MVAIYPDVHVEERKKQTSTGRAGLLNNILLIGAFDTLETNPQLFMNVDEAQNALGTDETYNGCKVLPILFTSGTLLAVNTTTENEGQREKTVTTAKLSEALAKVKGEDFDMVFVAESLTDDAIVILDSFLDEMEEMKLPAGYINGFTRANAAAYVTTAGLAGKHTYGLLTQALTVNGESLDLLESAAYYASVIDDMHVGKSMTMKEVPGVTGVSPELTFEFNKTTGAALTDGAKLMAAGITTIKAQNRRSGKFVVVNSEQPDGLDLYVNRVRDYVIKEMALHKFLGDRNRTPSHDEVIQELDRVKYTCIDTMDLLKDIIYSVEKEDEKTVGVIIDSLKFDGIITRVNVYYTIEVE